MGRAGVVEEMSGAAKAPLVAVLVPAAGVGRRMGGRA